jgi:nucleotide-binding universal stress UspA family protein
VAVEGIVCDGPPEEALAELAAARCIDLLVLGPHRPDSLRDLILGGTAERLLGKAATPLLFANGQPTAPWQRILLAIDASAAATHAAARAAAITTETSAAWIVFHAFEPRPFGGIAASAAGREAQSAQQDAHRTELKAALQTMVEAVGIRPERIVVEPMAAAPADMILREARAAKAGLVVAGTMGKSLLARMLLGSVAKDLLRDADMDLLLVPPPAT